MAGDPPQIIYAGPKAGQNYQATVAASVTRMERNQRAAEPLQAFDVVYLDGVNTVAGDTQPGWRRADAYSSVWTSGGGLLALAAKHAVGVMLTSAASGAVGLQVVIGGIYSNANAAFVGRQNAPIFVRSGAGGVTNINTLAAVSGLAFIKVGHVLGTNSFYVDPEPPVVLGILSGN